MTDLTKIKEDLHKIIDDYIEQGTEACIAELETYIQCTIEEERESAVRDFGEWFERENGWVLNISIPSYIKYLAGKATTKPTTKETEGKE